MISEYKVASSSLLQYSTTLPPHPYLYRAEPSPRKNPRNLAKSVTVE